MSKKKKRLFYLHEGIDAFVPFEPDYFESYIEGYDGDTYNIKFKIRYMTDEEFENLPTGE